MNLSFVFATAKEKAAFLSETIKQWWQEEQKCREFEEIRRSTAELKAELAKAKEAAKANPMEFAAKVLWELASIILFYAGCYAVVQMRYHVHDFMHITPFAVGGTLGVAAMVLMAIIQFREEFGTGEKK